jgi:hypothetical protein
MEEIEMLTNNQEWKSVLRQSGFSLKCTRFQNVFTANAPS